MSATSNTNRGKPRFFVTYTGVKLPFNLINELQPEKVENRNTFFRAYYDETSRLCLFEKVAYGEVELTHRYAYHDNDQLMLAEITDIDDEVTVLTFDDQGNPV